MKYRKPAEVFPPGEFLRDELAARGWTQGQLAEVLGRPKQVVNGIVTGKRQITPQTALELSAALGTSPDFWLNLEVAYRLSRAEADPAITKRARRLVGAV